MGFGGKKKDLQKAGEETVHTIVSTQGWGETVIIGGAPLECTFYGRYKASKQSHDAQRREIEDKANEVRGVNKVVISRRPVRGFWKVTVHFTSREKPEVTGKHLNRLFG